ncbi:MAG TPA: hypothetical protein VF221_22590 [Chloroflexota bacterium]
MARKPSAPATGEIPWWGYLIVVIAIVAVILVALVVWHLLAPTAHSYGNTGAILNVL